jgi:predicted amidohydrolase YtcJ
VSTTLLRGGRLYVGVDRPTTAMAIEDGRIVWTGTSEDSSTYDGADEVVELGGAWVAPAFVDAHVHVVQTGDQLSGLDLSGAPTRGDALDRLARYAAAHPDGFINGTGWDETTWPDRQHPTADEIEAAAPGRVVHLRRVDGHSGIASRALLALVPEVGRLDGYTTDGRLERDAKRAVNDLIFELMGPDQRLGNARAALREMARLGIGAFHEIAAPHIGPDWEIALVRRAAHEVGLQGTYYWGSHLAFDDLDRLEVTGLAGDLNVDGALGSRTASLRAPYADQAGHSGHAYLDPDQIAAHVVGCTRRGVQAGFHCIGDAAIDAIVEGFAKAAATLGGDAIRAQHHRLEHVEMPSPEAVSLFSDLEVVASVQPRFDDLWGGPDQMYAARVGDRWKGMNPFLDLSFAGVRLAFGSDGPVTSIEPWGAVRAAIHHRTPGQELTPYEAFRAHTGGGWAAARVHDAGHLRTGARATYAVWDDTSGDSHTLPDLDVAPRCLRTVVDGVTIHEEKDQ